MLSAVTTILLTITPIVVAADITSYVSVMSSNTIKCTIERTYHPSRIEQFWVNNIDTLADYTRFWNKGCAKMKEFSEEVLLWMEYWKERDEWTRETDRGRRAAAAKGFNKDLFSYFFFQETCGDQNLTTKAMEVPIEPLMSFLRHPLYICFDKKTHQLDKNYMLPLFIHELHPGAHRTAGAQNFLFDLGASTYYKGLGGASQQWFYETYRARGLEFDRILAWEANPMPPEEIFTLPADVIGKLSYYNIPAKTGVEDVWNPLRILKKIASPEDLVVVKIDIDNHKVETAYIQQILEDPEISGRIDELYFEHHVSMNPMEAFGWRRNWKSNNMTQSYQLFTALRKLGIRAHSWV